MLTKGKLNKFFNKYPEALTDIANRNYNGLYQYINENVAQYEIGDFTLFLMNSGLLDIDNSLTQLEPFMFSNCIYPLNSLPKNLRLIDTGCFWNSVLTFDGKLPETLFEISSDAFRNCASNSKFILPESLQYIGDNAFEGMRNLKSIYFPSSLQEVGSTILGRCPQLKEIHVSGDIPDFGYSILSSDIDYECTFYVNKQLTYIIDALRPNYKVIAE